MRLAPLLVVFGLAEPARAAGNGGGDDAAALVTYPLIAIDGGAVLTFGYLDLDRHRGTAYGSTELAYNVLIGSLTRDLALEDGGAPSITAAAIHSALVIDGVAQIGESRRWRTENTIAVAGLLTSFQWFVDDADKEGDPLPVRGAHFGAIEIACNVPLAVGLWYVTVSEALDAHYGRAALAATGLSLSAALIVDGVEHIQAAHAHHHLPKLAPTMVDGGGSLGLGLGTRGRW